MGVTVNSPDSLKVVVRPNTSASKVTAVGIGGNVLAATSIGALSDVSLNAISDDGLLKYNSAEQEFQVETNIDGGIF